MNLGFYPGCSLEGSSREFNESLLAVAERLGAKLVEVPDWNCCGATAAHNLSHDLALALPARVLAKADGAGMELFVVPCSACYHRLVMTRRSLLQDPGLRERIEGIIEEKLPLRAQPLNVVEALELLLQGSALESLVQVPLQLRVACYYGCLMVRPPQVLRFDHPEDPTSMDRLLEKVGATPVEWAFKVECCGAGFSISRTDLVAKLSAAIVRDATKRGAQALVVACPMCHANLDMRRGAMRELQGAERSVPVLYLTQALGLALGISFRTLGLHRHVVPVRLPQTVTAASRGG